MGRKDQFAEGCFMSKKRPENEDDWLLNAEVRTRIVEEKGRWVVSLVFVDTENPRRFLVNEIGNYRTKQLAEIYARSMKQTAEKDPRGTQKVKKRDYDSNNN